MKRCCINCEHYMPGDGINCNEDGESEIGDPHKELTDEDCNSFSPKPTKRNYLLTVQSVDLDEGFYAYVSEALRVGFRQLDKGGVSFEWTIADMGAVQVKGFRISHYFQTKDRETAIQMMEGDYLEKLTYHNFDVEEVDKDGKSVG